MKRTLAIAMLCALVIATVGTTAAVAVPPSQSYVQYTYPLYYPTYESNPAGGSHAVVVGSLTLTLVRDPHTGFLSGRSYAFTAQGLEPNKQYELKYWQTVDYSLGIFKSKTGTMKGSGSYNDQQWVGVEFYLVPTVKGQPTLTLTVDQPNPTTVDKITFTVTPSVTLWGQKIALYDSASNGWRPMTEGADGTYSATMAGTLPGTFTAYARFEGNDQYLAADSNTVTVTITGS